MFNKERDRDQYLETQKWGRKAYPWAHRVIAAIEVILPPVTGIIS